MIYTCSSLATCLTRKKVGDGFVAILGRDAERTPSAVSYFPSFL